MKLADILNNREIAIVLWAIILLVYLSFSKKMAGVRNSFGAVVSAFFVKQIMIPIGLMLAYMAIVIYFLWSIGLWNSGQIKNTIVWCFFVGFLSFFNLEKIKKDRKFFKHAVLDNLKILAIITFVVRVYTFPLVVEFVLLPFYVMLTCMLVISEKDEKHQLVRDVIEKIIYCIGSFLIAFTVYKLVTNFKEFGQEKTAYDFFVPILLTVFYFPFIFLIMIYSAYEQVFVRHGIFGENNRYKFLAKIYSIILFNVRIDHLERWADHISRKKIESHSDLIDSINFIFRLVDEEKNPKDVSKEMGWSPYLAKDFLSAEELETGFYKFIYDEDWGASTPLKEISEGLFPNRIAYYVEGNEKVAKCLKIKVYVNDISKSEEAHNWLQKLAEKLSIASLGRVLSEGMKLAISEKKSHSDIVEGKKVLFSYEEWPNNRFGGYELKFSISSV